MKNIFIEIDRHLAKNQRVVLATIIRQSGSSPRQTGTRCLVQKSGAIIGTIGGGLLEFEVIKTAGEVFRTEKSALLKFSLTGEDVAGTDMLCGGTVDVYLEPLFPVQKETVDLFNKVAETITGRKTGVLLTRISDGVPAEDSSGRLFINSDGTLTGQPGEWESLPGMPRRYLETKQPQIFEDNFTLPVIFAEPIQPDDTLYIFGAGHISTFLAPLAKSAGFTVIVIDDRKEFANEQRFPAVDKILAVPFPETFARIQITPSSYIVLVTRGHTFDLAMLREALKTDAGYIGMIGSRTKRNIIYKTLVEEGVSQERLDQVYSPIGLPIGAQTPEQIAVSIVAELIQVRSQLKNVF
jgi:xanthine dehydrogenase accessory factor